MAQLRIGRIAQDRRRGRRSFGRPQSSHQRAARLTTRSGQGAARAAAGCTPRRGTEVRSGSLVRQSPLVAEFAAWRGSLICCSIETSSVPSRRSARRHASRTQRSLTATRGMSDSVSTSTRTPSQSRKDNRIGRRDGAFSLGLCQRPLGKPWTDSCGWPAAEEILDRVETSALAAWSLVDRTATGKRQRLCARTQPTPSATPIGPAGGDRCPGPADGDGDSEAVPARRPGRPHERPHPI
jgi:hypothetical protein